jgi:hypothetical protein
MHWKFTVCLVCIFGVLKKFRPGSPFMAAFLESAEFKNFTNQQVNSEIYPYWTYANLISMVIGMNLLNLIFLTNLKILLIILNLFIN